MLLVKDQEPNKLTSVVNYRRWFVYISCGFRRRFLYMVNLEAPSEPQRKISRQSKWDVGTVQWNRHRSESHIFAASVSSAGTENKNTARE